MLVWCYLGSKEEGPTVEEVKVLVEASELVDEEDEQATEDALEAVISVMGSMSYPDNDDSLVFTPFMNIIDKIANKCFKTYKGSLGAHNADHEQALKLYCTDVVEVLQEGFMSQSHSSQDEKKWHDVIVGCTYMALSDTCREHLPFPLMIGYLMDHIWGEFKAAKDGYTEMSTCVCECRLKTHQMVISDCELVQKPPAHHEDICRTLTQRPCSLQSNVNAE